MPSIQYKVVELHVVSEETLEDALNTCTAAGWFFDGVHFVVKDGSRRPTMAFVTFIRSRDDEVVDEDETASPDDPGDATPDAKV